MSSKRKLVSIIICITMVLCAIMPHFALDEETIENMTVEQTNGKNYVDNESIDETTTETVIENIDETTIETIVETIDETIIEISAETTEETITETLTETIEETTTETNIENIDETIEETMTETVVETTVETTVDNTIETTDETTTETTTTIKVDNNLTVIIEESTSSETKFEENEIFGAMVENNMATNSEIENFAKENANNGLGQTDNTNNSTKKKSNNVKEYKNSYTPAGFTVDKVDRDKLKNGLDSNGLFGSNANIPNRYDSREHQNDHGIDIIPPPRDQGQFGSCWAFACIGMVETSIRSKNLITSSTDEGTDLSEAALALFAIEGLEDVTNNSNYIDKPGVEGADYNCINYDYYMDVEHISRASMSFADAGCNEPGALMMLSTYMGVVSENDFPYTEENINAIQNEMRTTGLANSRKPYAFNKNRYEVINVEFLDKNDRDSVKEAIMKYGGVGIGYNETRNEENCHEHDGEWYYLSPDKSCKILDNGSCGEENALGANHAVMVVGWDDNIGFNEFFYDGEIYEDRGDYVIASYSIFEDESGKYYPTYKKVESRGDKDGAWLVRNSWGDDNNKANHGYFWLPYDDLNLDSIISVVDADEAGKYKYNYHYDTTLTIDSYNYHGLGKLANIFKTSSDEDQVLEAVNIGWISANNDYEIQIYTKDNKMSDPEDGELKLTQSVHNGSSGIKTIVLDDSIRVNKDTYFSVIVKANTVETEIFYDCTHADSDSNRFYYNEVHLGESWENDDGTWKDLNINPAVTLGDKIYGYTPRIRALTNTAPKPPAPTPTPIPSGGDSGGSGGSDSGKGPLQINNQPTSLIDVPTIKTGTNLFDSSQVKWLYDVKTNKFKLNIDVNGQHITAVNGFYTLNEVEIKTVNKVAVQVPVQNTYYFDSEGSMLTGWIKTLDNKTYFFENEKTANEGKMTIGWKLIQNDWYYFDIDGSMLMNSYTPDRYYVGVDGKMQK